VGSGAVELATRKANGIVRFWEGWVRNEGLLTEVSEKRKGYGKCGDPSKFAMVCTATEKIGYCAVPDFS
jgi:hypothetical protein